MTKVININGQRFALPEGMAMKDVQSLAGFIVSLIPVEADYDYDSSSYLNYLSERSATVQLETVETTDRNQAKAQSTSSYERYKARKAEQAS